jgi:beta-galactosidase
MKRLLGLTFCLIVLLAAGGCSSSALSQLAGTKSPASAAAHQVRSVESFDNDWRFIQSDARGAENPQFDDSSWAKLNVPHDWAIAGPFDAQAPTRSGGGYAPSGVGYYRKTFSLPASDQGKRFFIDFDGVMANSDVWINGKLLGHRPYGYSSFRYDMTDSLKFGDAQTNVLSVRADNAPQPASRWYSGAGIYRHVRLVKTSPVHVDHWATFVTTPTVTPESADVRVQTSVVNQSSQLQTVWIEAAVVAPDGTTVKTATSPVQAIAAGATANFDQPLKVEKPHIWNLDDPKLYSLVTTVKTDGKTVDDDIVRFGMRTFEFKTESGFWLNGKNMKLLGVCLHHDGGAFGAAVPREIMVYRFAELQKLGVNAIRTAHNPPSPEFLDLCDEMGMLVMDEALDCWTVGKNTYDYHVYFNEWWERDTADMVRRDRNHPSIVLYSAGNEIHDTPREELAKSILKPMVDVFHKWDPTRPVTQALFRPNVSHDYTNGLADMLDVIGTNYRDAELLQAWRDKPGRKIVGTEQQHGLDTWLNLRDNPQHSGQFLWSGIDYMGEAVWPNITAASGLLDRTGAVKNNGLQRQSLWSDAPVLNMVRADIAMAAPVEAPATAPGADAAPTTFPGARGARAGGRGGAGLGRGAGGPFRDWTPTNPAAAATTTITIYSNAETVELFLNDKSQGVKEKPANDNPRTWQVPYTKGVLRAEGKNGGKVVVTDELRTAGKPMKVQLSVHRSSISPKWDDVAIVTAQVVDANSIACPDVSDVIKFNITGPGVIAAVDNGNNASSEPFQATERPAYRGRVVAYVKATGSNAPIVVTAQTGSLMNGKVTIQTSK